MHAWTSNHTSNWWRDGWNEEGDLIRNTWRIQYVQYQYLWLPIPVSYSSQIINYEHHWCSFVSDLTMMLTSNSLTSSYCIFVRCLKYTILQDLLWKILWETLIKIFWHELAIMTGVLVNPTKSCMKHWPKIEWRVGIMILQETLTQYCRALAWNYDDRKPGQSYKIL